MSRTVKATCEAPSIDGIVRFSQDSDNGKRPRDRRLCPHPLLSPRSEGVRAKLGLDDAETRHVSYASPIARRMTQPSDDVSAFFRSGRSSLSTLTCPRVSVIKGDIKPGCHALQTRTGNYPVQPLSAPERRLGVHTDVPFWRGACRAGPEVWSARSGASTPNTWS